MFFKFNVNIFASYAALVCVLLFVHEALYLSTFYYFQCERDVWRGVEYAAMTTTDRG